MSEYFYYYFYYYRSRVLHSRNYEEINHELSVSWLVTSHFDIYTSPNEWAKQTSMKRLFARERRWNKRMLYVGRQYWMKIDGPEQEWRPYRSGWYGRTYRMHWERNDSCGRFQNISLLCVWPPLQLVRLHRQMTCQGVCSISTTQLFTNSLNSADVPLSKKQTRGGHSVGDCDIPSGIAQR